MITRTALASPDVQRQSSASLWLPIIIGLLVMYVPVYADWAINLWVNDKQIHGLVVFAVVLAILWRRRSAFTLAPPTRTYPFTGSLLLVLGLISYIIGRSQQIPMFEVGSQIPIFLGTLLLTLGWGGIKAFWFPAFFQAFMVPLPGFIEAAVTVPLKQQVSRMAEALLYVMHYPIARNGVIITIGQYQLLIANACSGLHSIVSLAAMGSLYLFLMRHSTALRNVLVALCIIPMAIITNVMRVITLALITYYWGAAAGQGFLHSFSGVMLFSTAVLGLYLIDSILGRYLPDLPKHVLQHI